MSIRSGYPKYIPRPGETSNLFKPIKVGDMQLEHRVVLPPLTRFRAPKHVPNSRAPEYYSQRGDTPGTLLVTEATFISPRAGGYQNAPGMYTDEQSNAWKKVFDAVHEKKSYVFVQLWALGRTAFPFVLEEEGQDLVSASAIPYGGNTPRPLTIAEIKSYADDYAAAAKRAVEAGADGVEIHGANGYLLDQFLHANSNHRTDEYGGSIENRARFLLEVVDKLIEAVGPSRVGLRLSPWGRVQDMDVDVSPVSQFGYVAEELERRARAGKRIAYVHLVEPRVDGVTDKRGDEVPVEDTNLFFHFAWNGPIIRAGGLASLEHDVANIDERTLVAMGRYFISNPDLVAKLKTGTKYTKYIRKTFYWDTDSESPLERGYVDYPKGYQSPEEQSVAKL